MVTQGLDEFSAYVADEWNKKWTVDDPVEAGMLECMAFVVSSLGDDCMSDPETCSALIQEGSMAFIAKGKGKGKGKYPVRPSNLTIEDRRKMLADLKARTPCKDCGRKGHWRGDKECTMQRHPAYERRAHVATRFCDAYSTSRCTSGLDNASRFFSVGDDEAKADTN